MALIVISKLTDKLNIFSFAYWSFNYRFLCRICSMLLCSFFFFWCGGGELHAFLIFKINLQFFIYSGGQSFARHMAGDYDLPFTLLVVPFVEQSFLILTQNNLSIFLLLLVFICILLKKLFPSSRSQKPPSIFSSGSFIVYLPQSDLKSISV